MSEIESLKKIEGELVELSELANKIIQNAKTERDLDENFPTWEKREII